MVLFELDPDIIRWGLHHLLPAPAGYSPHCRTQTTPTTPCTAFARPPHQPIGDMGTSSSVEIKVEHVDGVDNDAIIAQALQEELSNVAFAEASGPTSAADNQQHSAVLTQQWLRPRAVHVEPASQEAGTREEPFSTCSSPGDDNNVQDSQQCLIELMDNFSVIDGEVGKRLNNMVPVPHVPKTNGEIPSVDEAISDHQRLLDRLVVYGLVDLKVKGDGNCQFRALSDQFYRTPEHHRFVRQQVVKQLESHPEIYAGYVPMDYREYLKKMSKSGEWGDHVTLQAAADSYGVKIFILTSFRDTCYIEILPVVEKSRRVICLSFWAEVHYNSIYPEGELPVLEFDNKRKRWWPF
ncbi:OTU domain-containing protein [Zea mays]|uniref:ubiquitinyl hydrolase 1 n=2 Tax=Zea mays TaxID=4577 RepID=B6T6Y3_MAIZE|nr:OVARIAN TUMOR DOMAIN-containing deubiquitinating enzyme 9 [Zea mays]ACG32866.1 cysteine-type peptidase [Zea mays]AQK61448.1 Cysteine-type peptidase [Zea mays]AQK61449.1 Cysteine-type peptidase [Zea mays]PWZ23743.1 OTU domain-containing protein [Zea mays]|eukprot:NP_001148776.1 cysteine-type peptidase [Zea mays]